MGVKPEKSIEEVVAQDGRYPLEAFGFLNEGLGRAVQHAYGEVRAGAPPKGKRKPKHVTGRQLCLALCDEALERWGLLARKVLERWNIKGTLDFGNMVYLLVNNNLMQKTEQDSLEDFRDVYDFAEAFTGAGIKLEE